MKHFKCGVGDEWKNKLNRKSNEWGGHIIPSCRINIYNKNHKATMMGYYSLSYSIIDAIDKSHLTSRWGNSQHYNRRCNWKKETTKKTKNFLYILMKKMHKQILT